MFVRVSALEVHDLARDGPAVVHPISVAEKPGTRALRLCIDANYTNIFEPYRPVTFELLQNVLPLLQLGDLASASDLTKGYLHMRLHPSARSFLAIRFDGVTYVFSALPFGLQSAVWAFSSVMRAMYLPMRMAGWRLSFMIDDALTLWRRMVDACLGASVFVRILCSLGCHMSLRKCRLGPNPAVRYEDMMLDPAQGAVLIPTDKLQGFDDLVHFLITSDPSLFPPSAG